MKVNAPETAMIQMDLATTKAWIKADDLRRATADFAQHGEICGISMQRCFADASRAPHQIIVHRDPVHAMRKYISEMNITALKDLLDALFTRWLIADDDRKKWLYGDTARILTTNQEIIDPYIRVCFEMWQASRIMVERYQGLNLGDNLGTFHRIRHEPMHPYLSEKMCSSFRL